MVPGNRRDPLGTRFYVVTTALVVAVSFGLLKLGGPMLLGAVTTLTLAVGLFLQAVFLTLYLYVRDRAVLVAIFRAWRPSLLVSHISMCGKRRLTESSIDSSSLYTPASETITARYTSGRRQISAMAA